MKKIFWLIPVVVFAVTGFTVFCQTVLAAMPPQIISARVADLPGDAGDYYMMPCPTIGSCTAGNQLSNPSNAAYYRINATNPSVVPGSLTYMYTGGENDQYVNQTFLTPSTVPISPQFLYYQSGNYMASTTVTTPEGAIAVWARPVTIEPFNLDPVAQAGDASIPASDIFCKETGAYPNPPYPLQHYDCYINGGMLIQGQSQSQTEVDYGIAEHLDDLKTQSLDNYAKATIGPTNYDANTDSPTELALPAAGEGELYGPDSNGNPQAWKVCWSGLNPTWTVVNSPNYVGAGLFTIPNDTGCGQQNPGGAPNPPEGVIAYGQCKAVDVGWTNPGYPSTNDEPFAYEVFESTGPSMPSTPIATVVYTGGALGYKDTGLQDSTNYYYWVESLDHGQTSTPLQSNPFPVQTYSAATCNPYNSITLNAIPNSVDTQTATYLQAIASSNDPSPAYNYSFWWDCQAEAGVLNATVAQATQACGGGPDATLLNTPGLIVGESHTYPSAGIKHPFVVVEHGAAAAASDFATVTVSAPYTGQNQVSLNANPPSGPVGTIVSLQAVASSTAVGPLGFTFWWDCPYQVQSISDATTLCGDPRYSSNGDNSTYNPTGLMTVSLMHAYATSSLKTPLVFLTRGTALAAFATTNENVMSAQGATHLGCLNSACVLLPGGGGPQCTQTPNSCPQQQPPVITVTVAPQNAQIVSGGTQQYAATVTGTANQSVTWTTTSGTIDANGFFTAPQVVAPTGITITATSVADPNQSGIASAIILPQAAPLQCAMIAAPSVILSGKTSTLEWTCTAPSCSINGQPLVGSSGNKVVSPLVTTMYTLACVDPLNGTKNVPVTVTVSPNPGIIETNP